MYKQTERVSEQQCCCIFDAGNTFISFRIVFGEANNGGYNNRIDTENTANEYGDRYKSQQWTRTESDLVGGNVCSLQPYEMLDHKSKERNNHHNYGIAPARCYIH